MGKTSRGQGKCFLWLKARVDYAGDECLPWPFSKDSRVGRGMLGYNGKQWWAHRLMCVLVHGEPPTPKHQAAHSCGKGHYGCVNPRHLSWKTNSENQLDRRVNGSMLRNPYGPRPGLSPEQIEQIKALKGQMTQVAIAKKFGVSLGCVQYWLKYRAVRGHDQQRHRSYTKAEETRLRQQLDDGLTVEEIANELGRTIGSVGARVRRMRAA